MTAAVRIFSFAELEVLPVSAASSRYSTDSVFSLSAQYLAKEAFSVDTVTQSDSAAATAPTGTRCLHVQVQTGKEVAYEIAASGAALKTASATTSMRLEGKSTIPFGVGWRISLLDVTGV